MVEATVRYIVNYRTFTTIINAKNVIDAAKRIADDLYDHERRYLHDDITKTDILLDITAREATTQDEEWYRMMLTRQ